MGKTEVTEIDNDDLIGKDLLLKLAKKHKMVGNYGKEKKKLERALKIIEKHYVLDHTEVAVALNNLENAFGNLGDYVKQRKLLERALAIYVKYYGVNHRNTTRLAK